MLPFLLQAEGRHTCGPAAANSSSSSSSSSNGPLPVCDHVHVHGLTQAWVQSLGAEGWNTQVGVIWSHVTQLCFIACCTTALLHMSHICTASHVSQADYNSPNQGGNRTASASRVTQRNGARISTAHAYIHPHASRSNLHVMTSSLVTRVLFDADKGA